MSSFLAGQLAKLPKSPGVYLFLNQTGSVVYVGKSVNLAARVSSYFARSGKFLRPARILGTKTARMVGEVRKVETILVKSELEALMLEARLIKEYQPRYNVVAKDDKRPLYIKITAKEEFPTVSAQRYQTGTGAVFFGPFPAAGIVRQMIKVLRRTVPFHQGKIGKRKCFYAHIGLCNPCPAEINKIENEKKKRELKRQYRKQIRHLVALLEGKSEKIKKVFEAEMKTAADEQDFETAAIWRDRLGQLNYLTQPFTPATRYIENPNLVEDERKKEAEELFNLLKRPLHLRRPIRRIEGFDSSHIRGKQAAVSMVTFVDGVPEKNLYRKFKIRLARTGDDLVILNEALTRRLKRDDWGFPDLVVIDGGTTQVGMAKAAMESRGKKIPVVGLAKRWETLVIPQKQGFLQKRPTKDHPAMKLLVRVRDESHRFAQSYHKLLRTKQMLE